MGTSHSSQTSQTSNDSSNLQKQVSLGPVRDPNMFPILFDDKYYGHHYEDPNLRADRFFHIDTPLAQVKLWLLEDKYIAKYPGIYCIHTLELKYFKKKDKYKWVSDRFRYHFKSDYETHWKTLRQLGANIDFEYLKIHARCYGGGTNIYIGIPENKNVIWRYPIKSYHVSCRSFKPKKYKGRYNLGGVVLYSYMGDHENFEIAGIKCQPGYIIIKRIQDIDHILSYMGQIHGKVYKSVFGVDPCFHVVGSGFAYKNGEWKYISGVFNSSNDLFHTMTREMNQDEQKWIEIAVKNWIDKGQQTTPVTDDLALLGIVQNEESE